MMAAATAAARTFGQILFRWQPTEFERFGNSFLDGALQTVQFLLRVEEIFSHGIQQQRIAGFFKVGDLRAGQRLPGVLFLVKRLTFVVHNFILRLRFGIGEKGVNALANAHCLDLFGDGGAKLLRFGFNFCRHKSICADNKPQPSDKSNSQRGRLPPPSAVARKRKKSRQDFHGKQFDIFCPNR